MIDYAEVLGRYEVWLVEDEGRVAGALILDAESDHLLIWSVAIAPWAQGQGLGSRVLAPAEPPAEQLCHKRHPL